MYARAFKTTYANELMKQSVMTFMTQNVDLTNGMFLAFKMHLSENQVLHVGLYPGEATASAAAKVTANLRQQVKDMGAKQEVLTGDITNFVIDGSVTLDQLTGSAWSTTHQKTLPWNSFSNLRFFCSKATEFESKSDFQRPKQLYSTYAVPRPEQLGVHMGTTTKMTQDDKWVNEYK